MRREFKERPGESGNFLGWSKKNHPRRKQEDRPLEYLVDVIIGSGLGGLFFFSWVLFVVWAAFFAGFLGWLIPSDVKKTEWIEVLSMLDFLVPMMVSILFLEIYENFLLRIRNFYDCLASVRSISNEILSHIRQRFVFNSHSSPKDGPTRGNEIEENAKEEQRVRQDLLWDLLDSFDLVAFFCMLRIYGNYAGVPRTTSFSQEVSSADAALGLPPLQDEEMRKFSRLGWFARGTPISLSVRLAFVREKNPRLVKEMDSILQEDGDSNSSNNAAELSVVLLEENTMFLLEDIKILTHDGKIPSRFEKIVQARLVGHFDSLKKKLEDSYVTNRVVIPSVFRGFSFGAIFIYVLVGLPLRMLKISPWLMIGTYPFIALFLLGPSAIRSYIGNEMLYNKLVNIDFIGSILTIVTENMKHGNEIHHIYGQRGISPI